MSIAIVESKAYNRLLKQLFIFTCHFLLFIFQIDLFCDICQSTEYIGWVLVCLVGIFCNTLIAHIPPLTQMLVSTYIPTENAFCISGLSFD